MLGFWQVTVPTSENYLYQNLEVPILSSVTNQIKVTRNTTLRGKENFLPLSGLKLKSEGHC